MYLSAIVNCYNKEEWLIECIDSILRQTLRPSEIILVHDACKKPAHYQRCKSIMLPENVGVAQARDVGVKSSKGEYLLFVDADDVLSPDYIEKMWACKADIAYPDLFIWYQHGKYKGKNGLRIPKQVTPKSILSFDSIIPVTSLMKREVYTSLGGFNEMPVFEDWEFFLRAMEAGYTFKKANTLLWYRQTNDSRNRIDISHREKIYKQITSKYEIKDGKLCSR